jgi:hypothetical protein
MDMSNAGSVDILCTGGGDSSFRGLSLALTEKATVQPHYIIDLGRLSSLRELQAINDIRQCLARFDSQASQRIKPTILTSINDIPPDQAITQSYRRLKSRAHLGSQYDWLARYAQFRNLTTLELSVHIDDKAYFFLQGQVTPAASGHWALKRSGDSQEDDLHIFANYRFPVLMLTKEQMRQRAMEQGFIALLEKSWFCFTPRAGQPCGLCNPCRYSIEEGMSYRLPRASRLRYRFRYPIQFLASTYGLSKMLAKRALS